MEPESRTAPDRSLVPMDRIINERYRVFSASRSTPDVIVYAAEDLFVRDRKIELEMLRSEFAADEEFVTALKDQARALAKPECAHPAIARVYACESTLDGPPVVVVEQTEGRTLREVLDIGTLDAYSAVLIASQVGEALEVLHRNGIVHGELRPEAIVVIRDGDGKESVKLVGVELTTAHRTAVGRRVRDALGSPYLAPEQVERSETERGETTQASDIYALGQLLRELLTGTKARDANPGWGEGFGISPATEKIIAKASEAPPQARYRDVRAMITDMQRAASEIDERPLREATIVARDLLHEPATPHVPRVKFALVAAITAIVMVAAVWIALGDRLTSHYRARASTPTFTSVRPAPPAIPPAVAPSQPSSAVTSPVEAVSVPPAPTSSAEKPLTSERRPIEAPSGTTVRRDVVSAPAIVRQPRAVTSASQEAPRGRTDPVASSARSAITEQPRQTEDDGSAIIDWLFKNRPGH